MPVVGDVLDGETTLVDVRTKKEGQMMFATLETEFTDQDGDRLHVESRTMIETGQVEGDR
jgi:acyl dehydratase